MTTTSKAIDFFRKESLYKLEGIARTSAHRFVVRAKNIATGSEHVFIEDCKEGTIKKIVKQ